MRQIYLPACIIAAMLVMPAVSQGQSIPQGPFSGTLFSTSGAGSVWNNPSNVQTSDGSYSTSSTTASASGIGGSQTSNVSTRSLVVTGFGFSLPSTAVVTGVTVDIQRKYSNSASAVGLFGSYSGSVSDNSIMLVNSGSTIGSDHSSGASWSTTESYYTVGSSSDVWSASLTSSIINSSSFGVSIAASLIANANAGLGGTTTTTTTASVNHIRVTVSYYTDVDGDGIPDHLDLDLDNDGVMDGWETKTCSGSQSLNWNAIADGTNPTGVTVTNSPVTMSVTSSFTSNANADVYEIRDYFTGTSEKEIHIHQTPSAYADNSATTINFSTAIYGLQFKLQDLDYQAGTWIDSVKVTMYYKNFAYILNSSQVTTSIYNSYKGNNWFIGKTSNAGNASLDGQVIINFPYMVDKIVIEYYNNDPAHGAQRMGIGGFTFCHISGADNDGDGKVNYNDLDSDNDGVPDAVEAYGVKGTTGMYDCAYQASVDWNSNNGQDPTAVTLRSLPVAVSTSVNTGTMTMLSGFTNLSTTAGSIYYTIDNYFSPTSDLTIDLRQNTIKTPAQNSKIKFSFSYPVSGLSFKLHDVDASAGQFVDSVRVLIYYGGVPYTLSASNYTIANGTYVRYASTNAFVGKTSATEATTQGTVTLTIPSGSLTDSVVIAYYNTDATTATNRVQGIGISGFSFCSMKPIDTDGDGIFDFFDLDSDNDGITDLAENFGMDADNSGTVDCSADANNDGLMDCVGAGLTVLDFDGDSVPNYLDLDSDNDGIPDVREVLQTDSNNDGKVDSFVDANGNGLRDALEGSNLALKSGTDSNADGIVDAWNDKNNDRTGYPNPYDLDSDGDGIVDAVEAGFSGGISVSFGVVAGTRTNGWATSVQALGALALTNTDAQGNPNFIDIDSDDDGITDNVEAQSTSSYKLPTDVDTDNDGIADVYEVGKVGVYGGGGLTPFDLDGDGTPDYRDTDTDNDGAPDRNEGDRNAPYVTITQTTIDASADSDGDGLKDIFDNLDVATLSTSNYYKNVTMGNMGALGGFDGPTPTGSLIGLQQSSISGDRDWRNLAILPLRVLNASVAYHKPNAIVNWEANNDQDGKHYEVEISNDASKFSLLGVVDSKRNSHSRYQLATILSTNEPVYYFRIKQVDNNGKVFYSSIMQLRLNFTAKVTAYPNPFISKISVDINLDKDGPVQLLLFDVAGKQVKHVLGNGNKGRNVFLLDHLANVPAGSYYLSIRTAHAAQTISVIK